MKVKIKDKKDFTNVKCNNIIRKDYNPFTVNCKIYEREGLSMKKIQNKALNEIKGKLNWKERVIVKIHNKTFNKVSDLIRTNTFNNMIK